MTVIQDACSGICIPTNTGRTALGRELLATLGARFATNSELAGRHHA